MTTTFPAALAIRFTTLASLGLVLLVVGCNRMPLEPALPPETVARVADQDISVEALRHELTHRSRLASGGWNESNRVWTLLEDLIRFEVFYSSALKAGVGQKPEVQAAIKRLIVARYRESLETNRVSPTPLTEAEIAEYYRSHPDRFGLPEQVRAAMIYSPVSTTATPEGLFQARQRAQAIRAHALAGAAGEATFGLLAHTNSAHQPSRYRGGDLGWLTRETAGREWEPALVDALFALQQPGQVSPVVQGKDGLYLFRLIERRAAAARPLAEARDAITYHLTREEMAQQEEKLYAALKAGVPIRINEAAVAPLMTNAPPTRTPPSLPSN